MKNTKNSLNLQQLDQVSGGTGFAPIREMASATLIPESFILMRPQMRGRDDDNLHHLIGRDDDNLHHLIGRDDDNLHHLIGRDDENLHHRI